MLNANAAKTSVQGVELEFTSRPTDNLLLRGGVAFTDSRFERYNFGALAQLGLNSILDDTELQWVWEWTANVSAQHVYWVDNLLDDDAPVAGVFTPNRAVLFDVVNGLRPGNQIFQGLVTAQNPRAWGVTAHYRF